MSALPDLDAWLPDPAIRTRHRRRARATPEDLWAAAAGLRLDETRTLGRLVQWRIPGTPADITFHDLLAGAPFSVLAEGPCWSLSGLCGRIWTTSVDYPPVDAQAFRAWSAPGTVRVLFAHAAVPDGPDHAVLTSEARVGPVDRRSRWALRSLWTAVGPFERLIGAEPLSLAVRAAQAADGTSPRAGAGG